MIYPSEADIIPFLKSLVDGLKPYARANDVNISFSSGVRKQVLQYQPYLLSQSFIQLICNVINLLPPKNTISVRVLCSPDDQTIHLEVENTGINLMRVNEICSKNIYSFTGCPWADGTLYTLMISLHDDEPALNQSVQVVKPVNAVPYFYREVQKRFGSHFTQTDRLMANLEKGRPNEAAFMQKINALITVNLEDENFDTNALCRSMSMSRTQLFRRLKSLIRQAPANHIKSMRLQKAKELLDTTDLTVSEIAFKTGSQTVSQFTKIFKKQYGIPPSVFRMNGKSATNE